VVDIYIATRYSCYLVNSLRILVVWRMIIYNMRVHQDLVEVDVHT